ncbi:MAG TPA: universal stress protein [Candidatus Aminicenantes bacterium]|mgnify:CR=1 FL=1|nr:universal stress protein [Candidatus Aminicenantes bacterium]
MKQKHSFQIQRVLWATDFSNESMSCLSWMRWVQNRIQPEAHALYVLPRFSDWVYEAAFFSLEDLRLEIESTREKSVSKLAEIAKHKGLDFVAAVREGIASEEISNYAQEHSIDMIFAGRRGLSEIEQILVGSTTARLVRNSHAPVFVVPKEKRKAAIKRILAPVDLNELSMRELCYAIALARQLRSELLVTHVAEFYNYKVPALKHHQLMERINRRIADVAADMDYEVQNIIHETGEPAHKIIEVAADQDIDVIVMATSQRRGLEKFLMGSVTQKVLLATSIPLIVLPPNGDSAAE